MRIALSAAMAMCLASGLAPGSSWALAARHCRAAAGRHPPASASFPAPAGYASPQSVPASFPAPVGYASPALAANQKKSDQRTLLETAHRLQVVGRYDEARELYRKLYERYPTSEAAIRGYGETLVMSKRYGEAERLYLDVRERDNRPLAYAVQLEQIHLLQGRYADAAEDCLDVLAADRNRIDWVRGELAEISGKVEGGADTVLKIVASRAEAHPKYGEYRSLAVELLVRASRPGEAAAMIEAMRDTEEMGADDLYRLGIRLEALGDDDLAMASLRLALGRQGGTGSISGAAFKLADLLAARGQADQSRDVLQNLSSRYPNSSIAFRAELQAAALESDVLGRPGRALALYEKLLGQRRLPVKPEEVKAAMGKCLLKLGRLSEAREVYAGLASDPRRPNPEAQYMAAEVSFYMGETDSALSLYSSLASEHPDWELANDAIDRVLLIQENAVAGGAAGGAAGGESKVGGSAPGDRAPAAEAEDGGVSSHEATPGSASAGTAPAGAGDSTGVSPGPGGARRDPLSLYATAELLTAIGRPDSALGYIKAIVGGHRDSPLVDDAVFRSAELYLLSGDVDRAIAACSAVAEESPDARLASVASEKLGDILWEEKGEPRRALDEYMKGLDKYPNSLVAPRVRDKVARLRREVG